MHVRPNLVWHALIDERIRRNWWPELHFEPEVGAPIRAEAVRPGKKKPRRAHGTITAIDGDGRELHAEWHTKRGDFTTTFHVLVSEQKQKCKIRVVEEGFPSDGVSPVIVAECRDGWREHLGNLASYLDDGENVRAVERSYRKRHR